jgi:hypothetical protein
MDSRSAAEVKLKQLTSKHHIFFTDRGNSSILLSMKLAKSFGKTKLVIQDQGGWITYSQYAKKLKLELLEMDTDYGLVDLKHLKNNIRTDSVLLMNSMPGYYALQENMEKISELCKEAGCFLINDASASIGREAAKHGDIILGSFGEWKPLEVKYGGYIAFDKSDYETFFRENFTKEVKDFYGKLCIRLGELPKKLKMIEESTGKIKSDLKGFDIIHREKEGLNVIVKFKNDLEKMKLLDYCKLCSLEFTLCPRYIRVLEDALSIEVKRA